MANLPDRNFSNLFHWSSSEWLGMANFAWFATFPIFFTKVAQNDLEWPILPDFALFQSFPTKYSEWPGTTNFAWFATFPIFTHWSSSDDSNGQFAWLQLFQSFSTEVAQNDSECQFCPICNFSNLFPSKIKVAQNDSEWPILPDSQLFPPRWLRMTRNGQFARFTTFQSIPNEVAQNDSEWPISPDLQLFHLFPLK